MREISINRLKLTKTNDSKDTPLSLSLRFENKINLQQVGNYFSTAVNSYKEIKKNIDSEEIYVIKFTQEQLKKFQNGDINFQKTADGKNLLPNLVKKGTNNSILPPANVEKLILNNPEAFQSVVNNVNQLANAQRINELQILLSEVKQVTLDIKKGQMDDRRAKILGAESTINQALLIDNNPQKQTLLCKLDKSVE